jgi:hypothetical protein
MVHLFSDSKAKPDSCGTKTGFPFIVQNFRFSATASRYFYNVFICMFLVDTYACTNFSSPSQTARESFLSRGNNQQVLSRASSRLSLTRRESASSEELMDISSSLLWLRDSGSFDSCSSIFSDSSEALSLNIRFGFDRELFNSRLYSGTIASLFRSKSKRSMRRTESDGPVSPTSTFF